MKEYKIYGLKLITENDIRYVGRTSESLKTRLSKHKTNAIYGKRKNHRVNWILKHINNIEIIIIEGDIKTIEESYEKEIFYIKTFREKYNLVNATDGGDGGIPGYKHTEEAKKKIGKKHKGKVLTDETKKKISDSHKGKVLTTETKKKLSIAFTGDKNPMYGRKRKDTTDLNIERTGWKQTDEVKQKMSEDRTGEKNSNYKHGKKTKEYKEKHKRIYKLNKEKVLKIREMWETGDYKTYNELGKIFDISGGYCSTVIRKVKWKNI